MKKEPMGFLILLYFMHTRDPFVKEEKELRPQPTKHAQKTIRKKPILGKIFLFLLIFIIVTIVYFSYRVYSAPEDVNEGGIFTQIKHLITSSDKKLSGENRDRINILLLGVGGANHEGPYLTDTMMLVSIQPSTKRVGIVSIPRDLLVDIPGLGKDKINTVYAYAKAKNPNTASLAVQKIVENIFDVPVHYYVAIDFAGFEKIIDDIGGITLNIDNTLDDPYYPIENSSALSNGGLYEHLVIKKGIRYMNGETALKYARSRKAKWPEGSDFARSKRQQKVIMAIKEKMLSPETYLNINILRNLYQSIENHVDTNFEVWEILRLYNVLKDVGNSNITSVVLDDSPSSPLVASTSTAMYFLATKTGDWTDLQNIEKNIFNPEEIPTVPVTTISPATVKTDTSENDVAQRKKVALAKQKKELKIEINNGTMITALAKRTSSWLVSNGYSISKVGNAPIRTYKKSLIYDLRPNNGGEKKEIIKELEEIFHAIVFLSGPPQDITSSTGKKIPYPVNSSSDILIILGEDWNDLLENLQ